MIMIHEQPKSQVTADHHLVVSTFESFDTFERTKELSTTKIYRIKWESLADKKQHLQ